jgi:hypothetical protein
MLLEDDGADIGQVDDHVDNGEFGVGEFLGDLFQRLGLGKADADDRIVAAAGSRWESFWISKSRYSSPVSVLKRSAPA